MSNISASSFIQASATPETVLTDSQWSTLMALADTIIPSIQRSAETNDGSSLSISSETYERAIADLEQIEGTRRSDDQLGPYLRESASTIGEFQSCLKRVIEIYMRKDSQKGVSFILSCLDYRAGCLIMTGSTVPFRHQPLAVREEIFKGWATARMSTLRNIHKVFSHLFKFIWLRTSPTLCPMIGFPRKPIHGTVGAGYKYEFLQFEAGATLEVLETDVVIVGSGCGGAVCAKNLAEAGYRVIVVEKGWHHEPSSLPMNELDGMEKLYVNGSVLPSDDASMTVAAGTLWGGGGSINWGASLQTQDFVRKEWAEKGLNFFSSAEFQNSLDRVCERMGVSTEFIQHNFSNKMLLEGSRRLGYRAQSVPQNSGGHKHYDGYCTLGCMSAEKQGPIVTWLVDAAKAGAQFIDGFEVDQVLFESEKGKRIAVGIQGKYRARDTGYGGKITSRNVTIKAKRVIVSAGTLYSPLILKRSGIKNPQIGRNLHLHPVQVLLASYKEKINPWEGSILTTLCTSFENLDGRGHGVKLENMVMIPSWATLLLPWTGGLDYKMQALKLANMAGFLCLTRDRDTGRVYPDPMNGEPRVEYYTSDFDRRHCLEGTIALAKIAYITGAEEVHATGCPGLPAFKREPVSPDSGNEAGDLGINDPAFQDWLTLLQKTGNFSPEARFGSAHQMGTCSMGTLERSSVVSPKGQVWGTEGLYVAGMSS
ncbi:MAG: hypothetical protein M1829_004012 [Trizodia sp. TS-e1964]|nr:MAG: hypothetical protein M1829_004012 [Trizodia sp. TS-e1964]